MSMGIISKNMLNISMDGVGPKSANISADWTVSFVQIAVRLLLEQHVILNFMLIVTSARNSVLIFLRTS
jgi:hypothetical protein